MRIVLDCPRECPRLVCDIHIDDQQVSRKTSIEAALAEVAMRVDADMVKLSTLINALASEQVRRREGSGREG